MPVQSTERTVYLNVWGDDPRTYDETEFCPECGHRNYGHYNNCTPGGRARSWAAITPINWFRSAHANSKWHLIVKLHPGDTRVYTAACGTGIGDNFTVPRVMTSEEEPASDKCKRCATVSEARARKDGA